MQPLPLLCPRPSPLCPGLGALAGWRRLAGALAGQSSFLEDGRFASCPRRSHRSPLPAPVPPGPLGAASPGVLARESSESTVPAPAPPPLPLSVARALSSGGWGFALIHSSLIFSLHCRLTPRNGLPISFPLIRSFSSKTFILKLNSWREVYFRGREVSDFSSFLSFFSPPTLGWRVRGRTRSFEISCTRGDADYRQTRSLFT